MNDFDRGHERNAERGERLDRVVVIADHASAILMRHWRTALRVEHKHDEFDPVTIADQESDALLRQEIAQMFPSEEILSEENESTPERYDGRIWMVDPLDGTKYFAKGLDCFSISIGGLENGKPQTGVVTAPARGLTYFGGRDFGAFLKHGNETRQLRASEVASLSEARILVRLPGKDVRPMDARVAGLGVRSFIEDGSVALAIARVAAGEVECTICTNPRVSKWDSAGGQAILEAVGGVVTDTLGQPLDYTQAERGWPNLVVASANPQLHAELIAALQKS